MRTWLLVLAVLTMGFAPAPLPRPDRGRGQGNRVFGTWVLKQVKHAGTSGYSGAGLGNGDAVYLKEEVTFSQGEMRIQNRDPNARQPERTVEIQLHAGVQHIDFLLSPDRLRIPGLYHVEGTTLTICYPVGKDKARPATFDNPNDIVLILERVKP